MTTEEYLVNRCQELELHESNLLETTTTLRVLLTKTENKLKETTDKYEKLKAAIRPTLQKCGYHAFKGRKYIEIKSIWDDEEGFTEMLQQFPELQEDNTNGE